MGEQWIVDSEHHGIEVFDDYRHFIRRFRELCALGAKDRLRVQLPPSASSLQRMVIADLAFIKPAR